jgi:hypothetical protein
LSHVLKARRRIGGPSVLGSRDLASYARVPPGRRIGAILLG